MSKKLSEVKRQSINLPDKLSEEDIKSVYYIVAETLMFAQAASIIEIDIALRIQNEIGTRLGYSLGYQNSLMANMIDWLDY